MKNFLLFFIFCSFLSCSDTKKIVATTQSLAQIQTGCPEGGKCQVAINQGKSIEIKQDEFGNIYYTLLDNSEKNVIVISYDQSAPKNVQDGNYREEIVFETNKKGYSGTIKDKSLADIKMLFGRFCYCKGATGYYPVTKGELTITKGYSENFNLNIEISQVPQILKDISFVLKQHK